MSIGSPDFLPNVQDLEPSKIELKIPPREDCMHTKCFCEENVWKLCELVQNKQSQQLKQCYAIFISNANKTIPLWCQKTGNEDSLCIWDYHVIFVYHSSDVSKTVVYDLDCTLPFPVDIRTYIELAIREEFDFQPCYKRLFRVIPGPEYLRKFASDRSMMRNEDGSWMKSPPPYPCIRTEESTNNIKDFISMDKNIQIGQVLDLYQVMNTFLKPWSDIL